MAFCLHPSAFAQTGPSGYPVQDFYAEACAHPYRSFDGGTTFTDLTPRFRWQTNHTYRPTAENPMPDWFIIGGRVADVGAGKKAGSLLNSRQKLSSQNLSNLTITPVRR